MGGLVSLAVKGARLASDVADVARAAEESARNQRDAEAREKTERERREREEAEAKRLDDERKAKELADNNLKEDVARQEAEKMGQKAKIDMEKEDDKKNGIANEDEMMDDMRQHNHGRYNREEDSSSDDEEMDRKELEGYRPDIETFDGHEQPIEADVADEKTWAKEQHQIPGESVRQKRINRINQHFFKQNRSINF